MSNNESNRKNIKPYEHASPGAEGLVLAERFQGPIPPPNILAEYQTIDPKLPLMIMEMALKEQDNRSHIENRKLDVVEQKTLHDATFGKRGQWLTFATAVVFLAVLAFFGYLGLETAIGWGFGTGGFIVISRFFVANKGGKKRDNPLPPTQS